MLQNNFIRIVIGTVLILLIPLIAMQFSDEVKWGPDDFAIIGVMLLLVGFGYELVAQHLDKKYRVVIAVAAVGLAAYIWAELAVGIFTNLGS